MTEQNQPIRIRAHTLVCLQGYQGEGYSEDFVNEMDRVTATLKNDPDRAVQIVIGADNFCHVCPHHYKGRCTADDPPGQKILMEAPDKMILMDKRVLTWLGITDGQILKWREIVQLIGESIDSSSMDYLCQDCSWRAYPFCSTALDALHAKVSSGEPVFDEEKIQP